MSIIIEGMDNTGKSVLADKLKQEFDLPVITRVGASREPNALLKQILTFLVLDPMVIFDRYPLFSEAVYGVVLRDIDIFTPPIVWRMYVDRLLLDEPFIIYCRPPLNTILNFQSEQMEGVIGNAKELVKAYDNLMGELKRMGFHILGYDYTTSNAYEGVRSALLDYLVSRS